MNTKFTLLIMGFSFLLIGMTYAQWPTSPTVNVRMCTDTNSQSEPTICRDGKGGAIIVWSDDRNGGTNYDIYAQRVDTNGQVKWTASGVPVCSAIKSQFYPVITSDGNGGAIITWYDLRGATYDIYAQRIDSTGTVKWATDGILVCGASANQTQPQIISDGSDGSIIIWDDTRYAGSGVPYTVFAQKIDGNGISQWTADGVQVNTKNTAGGVSLSSLTSDGSGGALISVQTNVSPNSSIYVQRITSTGVTWSADGTLVQNADAFASQGLVNFPKIASDGSGGAFVSWIAYLNYREVKLQRIDGTGLVLWATPVSISDTTDNTHDDGNQVILSGTGSAIVVWEKGASGAKGIFAQKVNASGIKQWTTWGKELASSVDGESEPYLVSTESGGAIATFLTGQFSFTKDVYAQAIDNAGTLLWGSAGNPVSTAANGQNFSGFQTYMHPTIISVGTGDAIVTWQDGRNGKYNIYAQKIFAYSTTGINDFSSINNPLIVYPNPFTNSATIKINDDDLKNKNLEFVLYNLLGCEVKNQQFIDGENEYVIERGNLPSGMYFYEIRNNHKPFANGKFIIE